MNGTALVRGVRGHCPRCGGGGIFSGLNDLHEQCPTCDLTFEREDGYWVGSMIVIMAMVLVAFFVVFVGGMLLTWPDVPWTGLLIAGIVVNVLVPVLGYGWSKTIWLGLDHAFNPSAPDPEAASVD